MDTEETKEDQNNHSEDDGLTEYERERLQRMAENQRRLEMLGLKTPIVCLYAV